MPVRSARDDATRRDPTPRCAVAARASWRTTLAAVIACALAVVAAGCGAGGKQLAAASGSTDSRSLTIAYGSAPNSLDPAKIDAAFEWYVNLAYDPLIVWGPSGTARPGLATSWHYVGSGNRVFELTLRPHVRFSDGSPLTAAAVKASLDYEKGAGGQPALYLANKTVSVTRPLTVRITSTTPDPQMPRELTQDYLTGNIIGPKALGQPKQLGTTTDGAGPYVLHAQQSVSGDHYVYTPNPDYWNKSAVHYKQVTVKVIANPNAVLDALKTGQVDVATGDYTTASGAQSAGLTVSHAPQVWLGLDLLDRSGKRSKPLADVRVRQAINYALVRATITKALFGSFGTPTDQTVVPGQDGWLSSTTYAYDLAKAKQLLAAAGYAKGFTLPVVTTTFFSQSQVVQAIAGELAKVGITLKLTTETDATKYVSDMTSKAYPAAGIGFGGLPIFLEGPQLFLPHAPVFNPFASTDPALESLYARAAKAPVAQRQALDQQVEQRLVSEAWFAPVTISPVFYYARSGLQGTSVSSAQPDTDPVWWHSGS
jgi:peptide/nickel transport system substrate-binding protein